MEIFSASLALCAGNSPVTGEFPSQRPVTRSFDVFLDLHLWHYMSVTASAITDNSSVLSTACSANHNKKNIHALHYWTFVRGNPTITDGFPSQRASNATSVSMSSHHHAMTNYRYDGNGCFYNSVHISLTANMLLVPRLANSISIWPHSGGVIRMCIMNVLWRPDSPAVAKRQNRNWPSWDV